MLLIVLSCALLLDYFFGEPLRYHPLTAFGRLADWLEERLNEATASVRASVDIELSSELISEPPLDLDSKKHREAAAQNRLNGVLATLICLLPAAWLSYYLSDIYLVGFVFEVIIVYFAIGLSSLKQHAYDILNPLMTRQFAQSRQALAKIVSRDTDQLDEQGICRATTESVLENGNDAVFGAIFWFLVAGVPGVVIYRLTNTLDAMWGYKNERFKSFGFFAARLDDVLNYIPARLTALTYALTGNWKNAMHCWAAQGSLWDSPNAGVVMAAGAGALDVQLGGGDQYHGAYKDRPVLGCGQTVEPQHIQQACDLLDRSTILWLVVVALVTLPGWL